MASDFQSFAALIGAHLQDRRYRDEVEAEILDHLELSAANLEATGLSLEEARRQAEAAFGDPALIGRLLRSTPRGGNTFVKFTKLGGLCGILAGLFRGLALLGYAFERNHLDPHPTSLSLRIVGLVVVLIELIPFPLFLLTLASTHAHLPGSRAQKRFLIVAQMAGIIIALWGLGIHSMALFVSGFLMMNASTVLAAVLLAVCKQKPNWILSVAMVVAGLGLVPSLPRAFAMLRLGDALGYTIGMIPALAWMVVGFTLLTASTDPPNAPVHGAN